AQAAGSAAPVVDIRGTFDGLGCMVDVLGGETLQTRPCAPPAAGDTWTLQPAGSSRRRQFHVTGRQAIQVPAGGFDAWRVEESDDDELAVNAGPRSRVRTSHTVYWYAPGAASAV